LHEAGWTLQKIGDRYSITAERVRQILRQAGVPPRGTGETARLRARLAVEGREEAIVRRFQELGDERAVARDFDLPVQTVVRLLRERLPHRRLYRLSKRTAEPRYSDDDIRACVRSAASEVPGALRLSDYAEIARGRTLADDRPWPSGATASARFRWTELLAQEGIAANASHGASRRYSWLDCVESVAALWRELGRPPTSRAYEAWSAGRPEVPSASLLRRRFGSWKQVLTAAAGNIERAGSWRRGRSHAAI
jgi:hypothetical protein